MSTIIPIACTEFATSGEERFYRFLQDNLKPDSQCFAWYSPSINGEEPDFVVYTPEVGLVVFEVKDWDIEHIRAADQKTFTLALLDGREEMRTNPFRQAREYVFTIENRLKSSCPQLLSDNPRYQGKPKLPLECAVVFAKITRDEYCLAGLHTVLPVEKLIFADDLALSDVSGDIPDNDFRRRLAEMLPPRFPFQLTSSELAVLRDLLWPEVRIALPRRAGQNAAPDAEETIRRLDAQQESLARRLDARKAIIHGPAGSGKSLVLAYKAAHELERLRQNGSDLPILLVCFNLTLVHYLKRLLAERKTPLGRKGVQVMHFYEFCRSILSEPLAYEREDATYYELVTQMARDAAPAAVKYGAVFVDEGQDFSDAMLEVLRSVCADGGMFWVACDTAQDLYGKERQWLASEEFKHFTLNSSYRATQKLAAFCKVLAPHAVSAISDGAGEADVFAPDSITGEAPCLRHVADIHSGAADIAKRILSLREQGVPYSEMMLLYASSKHRSLAEGDVPSFLLEFLEEQGILATWASQDAQSKGAWDITTDSITISTIHSMKGMDAEVVFVWGLDELDQGRMPPESVQALAYVACTRARRHLDVVYTEKTPLIEKMLGLCRDSG